MGHSASTPAPAPPPVVPHVIVFDFDCTLTTVHVFKALAGWSEKPQGTHVGLAVPEPHAVTELGQLLRLRRLGPAWCEATFGGPARAAELRRLLGVLSGRPECQVVLLTRGYVAVARKCLKEIGCLRFFKRTYGNIRNAYAEDPTSFDAEAASPTGKRELGTEIDLLGSEDDGDWDAKVRVLLDYRSRHKLSKEQIILLDDDEGEIGSCQFEASTIHVDAAHGLGRGDVERLFAWAGVTESWALHGWARLPDPSSSAFAASLPLALFNRAHMPLTLARHYASLSGELGDPGTTVRRRAEILVSEPPMLLTLVSRELTKHLDSLREADEEHGPHGVFSYEAVKPAAWIARQRIGLSDCILPPVLAEVLAPNSPAAVCKLRTDLRFATVAQLQSRVRQVAVCGHSEEVELAIGREKLCVPTATPLAEVTEGHPVRLYFTLRSIEADSTPRYGDPMLQLLSPSPSTQEIRVRFSETRHGDPVSVAASEYAVSHRDPKLEAKPVASEDSPTRRRHSLPLRGRASTAMEEAGGASAPGSDDGEDGTPAPPLRVRRHSDLPLRSRGKNLYVKPFVSTSADLACGKICHADLHGYREALMHVVEVVQADLGSFLSLG